VQHCPNTIVLAEQKDEYRPEGLNSTDKVIDLRSVDNSGYFTHENNQMSIRPGARQGIMQNLSRDVRINVMGGGYASLNQYESGTKLTTYSSAKVLSVAMIGASDTTITYDSAARSIIYKFQANGISDVICTFVK
jgi:hypothetical protein